jgi:Ca-activated chloride channel family protein
MFNSTVYENSLPGGVGRLEVIADDSEEKRLPLLVPLKRSELAGKLAGPVASLELTQIFRYSSDECAAVLEAVYRFPLPGDAAVTRARVSFGAVEIEAGLKEREAAEAEYNKARGEGRQAILTTREAPDVFTLHVSGLIPDVEITIKTDYVQLARPERAGWSLRVPLTIAPRYVRGDESDSRHAHGQSLLHLPDPGHRFSLDLTLEGAETVESTSHRLRIVDQGDGLRVRLAEGDVLADRDLLLTWEPRRKDETPHFQVLLHDDAEDGHTYFLALISPPSGGNANSTVAREVILLVDHSGSMDGPKWDAADWAVERFLSEMKEEEFFALGLFHSSTHWFSKDARRADQEAVATAIRFLRENRDSGGTELGVALEQALAIPRKEGGRARHVLIITDAEVSDAGRILRLATGEAERSDRRRISLLCIDASPNSFLAMELASRGGGVVRFLTSDPEQGDISTALDAILEDWGAPVLSGLHLDVNRPGALASGRRVTAGAPAGWTRVDLGDLPGGRSLWVVGRLPRDQAGPLSFRVCSGTGNEIAYEEVSVQDRTCQLPAVKALFGARQVLGLEFLIHSGYAVREINEQLHRLGYDPGTLLAGKASESARVYAENARLQVHEALRTLLVREALNYGVSCMETAFVAVRREAGKPVDGWVVVGNALPAGWSDTFASVALYSPLRDYSLPAPSLLHYRSAVDRSSLASLAGGGKAGAVVLFSGIPRFEDGQAVLYDSSADGSPAQLPTGKTLRRLILRFPAGVPARLDPELALLIFVGDFSSPRAAVKLADLVRQGGDRPLNIKRLPGEGVRLVLVDPRGAWSHGVPAVEVGLKW